MEEWGTNSYHPSRSLKCKPFSETGQIGVKISLPMSHFSVAQDSILVSANDALGRPT